LGSLRRQMKARARLESSALCSPLPAESAKPALWLCADKTLKRRRFPWCWLKPDAKTARSFCTSRGIAPAIARYERLGFTGMLHDKMNLRMDSRASKGSALETTGEGQL